MSKKIPFLLILLAGIMMSASMISAQPLSLEKEYGAMVEKEKKAAEEKPKEGFIETDIKPLTSRLDIESEASDLICLNFLNVDIREALSALAIEREINIITSQEVSGSISVHLYQVTLKEAMDAIVLAGGFGCQI